MGQMQDKPRMTVEELIEEGKPRMTAEELIEEDKPRMTAEELIEFYDRHYGKDEVFWEIFGEKYEFDEMIARFGSRGMIDKICKWKEGQE